MITRAVVPVALALITGSLCGQETTDPTPPNVVFIMADDLGYGEIGCYGQRKIETPEIDRLASQGMRFTQAYAGANVCQPSRCCLMTGMHTGHASVRTNSVDQMLVPGDVTVAEVLKTRGYATGVFGKWGLGFEGTTGHPLKQGFDEHFGQLIQAHAHFYYPYWVWHNDQQYLLPDNEGGRRQQYVEDEIHTKALDFIRTHRDGPFFAYIPYIIPHVELVVPEESAAPYRGKFPKQFLEDAREGYISAEDGFTTFAGMVARLDAHVGEIVALIDELGLNESTLIVFTSDNGPQGGGKDDAWKTMSDFFDGNGPLTGYKGGFNEGGIRVPFIARWTGSIPTGTTSDRLIAFWDVLPTLADLSGADVPAEIDGESFLPTLQGQPQPPRERPLYWEHSRGNQIERAARDGKWKVIQRSSDVPVELYDLGADVAEQHDVAAEHRDVVRRLTAFMDGAHAPEHEFPRQDRPHTYRNYVR